MLESLNREDWLCPRVTYVSSPSLFFVSENPFHFIFKRVQKRNDTCISYNYFIFACPYSSFLAGQFFLESRSKALGTR